MVDLEGLAHGADIVAALNAMLDGWNKQMGLRFVKAEPSEIVAELDIDGRHHQPYGLVHGGVYASMIETVTSVGAALDAMKRGYAAVGLDNSTSFLHAARGGTLRATARPLSTGKRTQLWEATVTDGEGRTLASGRVRLLCLEPGAKAGGETVAIQSSG